MARKPKEAAPQDEMTEAIPVIEVDETPQAEAHYRSRCGGALRSAREAQNLSVQEVASRLRLSPKQIEAIEADNFAILPEATIVRGFIRNYAKQLKINAEPLLDAYSVIVPTVAPHELTVKPSADMKMTSHKKTKSGSYAWIALALLMGLGVWLFYLNYVEKPSPTEPTASVKPVEPLPEPALPAAERADALQTSTELALPPPADTSANQALPAPTTPAPAAPTAPVANAAPDASLTPNPETPPVDASSGMAALEFNATQETWVNVVDANGREIYSKTIFAGSRESVDVKPPVNVTVGNAGATSLNVNGKSVDLAPHSRNNVAHIKLDK